jgi:hypothetical protein
MQTQIEDKYVCNYLKMTEKIHLEELLNIEKHLLKYNSENKKCNNLFWSSCSRMSFYRYFKYN